MRSKAATQAPARTLQGGVFGRSASAPNAARKAAWWRDCNSDSFWQRAAPGGAQLKRSTRIQRSICAVAVEKVAALAALGWRLPLVAEAAAQPKRVLRLLGQRLGLGPRRAQVHGETRP